MTFPVFASGDVLNASDMNAVGLWLVKTQTIGSAVSSVTVNDAFSATYDNYKIIISGGTGSADAALTLALGASATGYYGALIYSSYSAAGGLFLSDNNATRFSYAGTCSSTAICFNVDLQNPGRADRTIIAGTYATPSTGASAGRSQGFHNVATAYTSFVITTTSGTLTGGEIKVYGYRN